MLRVMDVATGELVDGPIDRCRYSPVAWLPGGKAFYYVRRLPPEPVPDGRGAVPPPGLAAPGRRDRRTTDVLDLRRGPGQDRLLRRLGQPGRPLAGRSRPSRGHRAAQRPVARRPVRVRSLAAPDLRVVQEGVDAQTGVQVGRDGRLYVFTDRGRAARPARVTDPADAPATPHWRDLVARGPRGGARAATPSSTAAELDRPVLLAAWTRHAVSEITVHDLATGERRRRTCRCPASAPSAGITERPEGGHEAWFGYTDHTTPSTVYRYDARTGETTLWAAAPGTRRGARRCTTRQVTYRVQGRHRRCGCSSSLRLRRRAGRARGRRSCTATAASASPLTPAYSADDPGLGRGRRRLRGRQPARRRRGGRGVAPRRHARPQAERLRRLPRRRRDAGRATAGPPPEQLAISGGSNGGLLVGAALTQRPDLYAAVVCSAPLLDMVRYEQFGLGADLERRVRHRGGRPSELGWLLAYSPYHHVREGDALPGRAVHRVRRRHPGRPAARPQDVRRAAARHHVRAGRPVLLRAEARRRPRGPRGEPDGRAVRRHAGVRRAAHRAHGVKAQSLNRAPGVWPVSRRNAATNALGVS